MNMIIFLSVINISMFYIVEYVVNIAFWYIGVKYEDTAKKYCDYCIRNRNYTICVDFTFQR